MLLKYSTPFAFLALVPVGAWLGGAWTFMGAAATPLGLTSLDALLGDEAPSLRIGTPAARWVPRVYILLQLATTAWAALWVSRPSASSLELAGLAISVGVTTGVFGFVAAHEMIHSRSRRERALGLGLLGTVFYMHFRIAHVQGHHVRAATRDDPASARLGEGLYAFLLRSIAGQLREAWQFEATRRARAGLSAVGPGNRMIAYLAIEGLFLAGVALLGARALVFVVVVAAIAVALLESFNYVAHYGLSRRIAADGKVERLAPHHSWNSGRRMNNASLFNMGRHSDHHRRMVRSYEELRPLDGGAVLPSGYAAALLTALVPPLWARVMDGRAEAVMAARPFS
ncbi:MAG TPA: alkane 1-monooxygenase [Sphingomicrobium sp.]|nr:alkane 1-monooxygenase [Sphingomicrobium sp.]